ncbi:MAG: T9SS type A sorting domain-containing protein [Bacteroidota bacterium]
MKNFFLYFAQVTFALTSIVYSQEFDLMNVQSSDKAAVSSHFTVTESGIEQYRATATATPFAIVTGETLFVAKEQTTTSVSDGGSMLTSSTLQQNYPNPFNNSTVIRYSVDEMSDVTIKVFDITGREVTTLVNETKNSGTFSIGFSNDNISSGTYIYRMISRSNTGKTTVETKKMIVMK